jgi:hypothetical protein
MSERKDRLESYHLCGRFPDKSIFLQPINDTIPEELGFIETLALLKLCTDAGSIPVCTIRCWRDPEGALRYFHGFFNDPSPEDELAKDNALLRIVANYRYPDSPRAAANLIEDGAVLDQLGITLEQQ